jgi:transcriptional regulator with XRE-family HTH domain
MLRNVKHGDFTRTGGTAHPSCTVVRDVPAADLQALIATFRKRYGNLSKLGTAIGVSASRMSRLAKGSGSLEVVNCLRLADVTGASPTHVLRAAGKAEISALIEKVYRTEGREATMPVLPPDEQQLIDLYRSLREPSHRAAAIESVQRVVDLLAEGQRLADVAHRLELQSAEGGDTEAVRRAGPTPSRRRKQR